MSYGLLQQEGGKLLTTEVVYIKDIKESFAYMKDICIHNICLYLGTVHSSHDNLQGTGEFESLYETLFIKSNSNVHIYISDYKETTVSCGYSYQEGCYIRDCHSMCVYVYVW